ncbi:retrovirus-related Pol polyprotein from transposon 297-like Protein [Elysia marginata]|uniref:Retrovirus-related Pol polyprotein from transposon 297-like Protein n=1 Tax=Elysia marginata TaxID=1093978 RepID=A0AAV4EGL9_9GAST|nr:retrovirus-related Pol polyprotein from transposon 297-like Protein [Elysia marginata]
MIFADYLSRVSPTTASEIQLDKIVHQVSISDEKYKALQDATAKDSELTCLKSQIIKGWPDNTKEVPQAVRKYWSMRDFLSIEDGLIIKNTAIIIPKSMKDFILDRLHDGHQGIEKCLLRARENVFWLGMTKDITEKVKECSICERYNRKSQQKQPLLQHEVPRGPFEKVAADIFPLDERTVQTVKNGLKKAKAKKENLQLALLSLRTTPIDNILPSPAELLFNRKVQGQIPHIIRHDSKSEDITRHLEQRQAVQKGYFDRQAHDLPPLLENQQVSVQDTGTGLWSPATIVKHSGEPRSYIIETPDGIKLRRNRLHLKDSTRARPADHPAQPDDDDAGDNAATEGESVRQHPSCAPDDPATRSPGLPPGSSNPPGKMTYCTSKPTTGLHTRSGRAVKPPRRFTNE